MKGLAEKGSPSPGLAAAERRAAGGAAWPAGRAMVPGLPPSPRCPGPARPVRESRPATPLGPPRGSPPPAAAEPAVPRRRKEERGKPGSSRGRRALHPTAQRARPARGTGSRELFPAAPGHGGLRAAAAALGLLRGGRRTERGTAHQLPL